MIEDTFFISNMIKNRIDEILGFNSILKEINSVNIAKIPKGIFVEGGDVKLKEFPAGFYVKPAIAEVDHKAPIVQKEPFAQILFLIKYLII